MGVDGAKFFFTRPTPPIARSLSLRYQIYLLARQSFLCLLPRERGKIKRLINKGVSNSRHRPGQQRGNGIRERGGKAN